ncbi:hypothetical protein [Streptomyces iconiensis]|uniref:Uncharacterized protein n=1 Tax=Streptomyces iconiensis TaxID=1384038 RepID=A0ABT7A672_9ACTN|nr:hypothetical protein [Streptomyces iconiensis]MDJ1136572.1 hypothetical protein [Streptomyces iconiensis]
MTADLDPEGGRNRRKRIEDLLGHLSLLYAIYKIVCEVFSPL